MTYEGRLAGTLATLRNGDTPCCGFTNKNVETHPSDQGLCQNTGASDQPTALECVGFVMEGASLRPISS